MGGWVGGENISMGPEGGSNNRGSFINEFEQENLIDESGYG